MPKYRLGMCVTSRLLQAFTRPSFRFSPLWNIVSVAAMFSSVFVTERCKQAMQAWVNANLQGRTNLTLYVHSTKSQSLLLYLKSGLVTEQRDCGQYWTLWTEQSLQVKLLYTPIILSWVAPLNALMTVKIITQRHRISEYLGDFERLSNHQAPT